MMNVVFIGAGRLATNLAQALSKAGHRILQVYSRTEESAVELVAKLAREADAHCSGVTEPEAVTSIAALRKDADVYVIALKDSVLPSLVQQIVEGREEAVFLHTSGSMPMDVLASAPHHGVLYPLQTFSKERSVAFDKIPFFIEGCDEHSLTVARELAESVSTTVSVLSSEERRQIHLAAVFVNNFVNHCYTMAADILDRYNLPFSHLVPLIDETACKIHAMPPREAQTGPAIRYDENVIGKHLAMLADEPQLRAVYEMMSRSIHNHHS